LFADFFFRRLCHLEAVCERSSALAFRAEKAMIAAVLS
jgi:hypothetical protein